MYFLEQFHKQVGPLWSGKGACETLFALYSPLIYAKLLHPRQFSGCWLPSPFPAPRPTLNNILPCPQDRTDADTEVFG
jgi:hypothetical protein